MEYDAGRDIIFIIILISIFVIHSVSTHQRLDSSSGDTCYCSPANWDLSAVGHVAILFTIGQQYRTLASMGDVCHGSLGTEHVLSIG